MCLNHFWILVWQQLVTPWHFISIYGLALDLGHGLALDLVLDHMQLVNCWGPYRLSVRSPFCLVQSYWILGLKLACD